MTSEKKIYLVPERRKGKLGELIRSVQPPDTRSAAEAQRILDHLTKPQGSLGRLEEIACQIAGITGRSRPKIEHKAVFTLAADHGVAMKGGVSAYPSAVTAQMVMNFLRGGAAINVFARLAGARVVVADLGVAADIRHPRLVVRKIGPGTRPMTEGPAMTFEQAEQSILTGAEIFEEEYRKGLDLAAVGDMGIGNTTAASAMTAVMARASADKVTGRGAGLDNEGVIRKTAAIRKAISVNKPDPDDPLEVLSAVGGFEIGGIAGVILAAAVRRVPVIVDGFIAGAGLLVACGLRPNCREYVIPGHVSQETGHRILLSHLGLKPLLDLELRLGEGTGAVLAMPLVEAAVRVLSEMATFKSAKVSGKSGSREAV
jgi:nicotinate-nucleotide--dimethylbenzimidazole phosphoribosyltransferase